MALVASLVQSLAWPAAVVVIVIILRKPIGAVLGQALLRRVKAGPLELEFDQVQAEVREELARNPELADAQIPAPAGQLPAPAGSLQSDLSRLARVSPAAAVMEASKRIERRLAEMLAGTGEPSARRLGLRAQAGVAQERGLISDETLAAIDGLAVLRDLAVYSSGEIGTDRARAYLALADGVMYALRAKAAGS